MSGKYILNLFILSCFPKLSEMTIVFIFMNKLRILKMMKVNKFGFSKMNQKIFFFKIFAAIIGAML
jgi:hypothetical protein